MRYVILILCMIWNVHAFSQGDCPENELLNSGFESGGTGWGVIVPSPSSIFNPPQPQISTDAYSGQNAAVACGPEMIVAYVTPFQNQGGRIYVVSACAKLEGQPTKVGFGAVYITLSGALTGFDTVSVTSNSYECYSKTFIPPPNQLFGIGFALEGADENDKLLIDDFCVEIFDSCEVGSSCDDGNPETVNDVINSVCVCNGTTCPGVYADAGPDQSIVPGQSTTLTASGGNNYMWNTGESTPSITVSPLETTTYRVCVTNGTNCQDCDDVVVSLIETYDISSCVWEDRNANGCKDEGEPGINNISIELYDAIFDIKLRTATTSTVDGETGTILFENWVPGSYYLKVKDMPTSLCITETNNCPDDTDNDFDQVLEQTDSYTVSENINHIGLGLRYKPLSISLVDFVVYQADDHNRVSWTIHDQENINHFVVERSINRSAFKPLETIKVSEQVNFQIQDSNLNVEGIYYYRLAIYLESGEVFYSNVSSVKIDKHLLELQVNPNVTSADQLYYSIKHELLEANAILHIFDINGNRIFTDKQKIKNSIRNQINISSYPYGVYYMIVNIEGRTLTQKFIKY